MIQTLIEEKKEAKKVAVDPRNIGAEEDFFGRKAPQVDVPVWRDSLNSTGSRTKARNVLSSEEESFLFRKYNYVKSRLSPLEKTKSRKQSRDKREFNKWNRRLSDVKNDLVSANMPLVLQMAKRCRIPNVDFPEMISEGSMALLRAIDKFDVSRGFKFSTYACRVILRGFNRMATNTGKYHSRCTIGLNPDLEKGKPDEELDEIRTATAISDLKEILENNTAELTDIEMTVLNERYGLQSGQPKTLLQTGKLVNRSVECVRQIQLAAIDKIREVFE
jgi:RNA polymerase sigma factor (sigma-70 family)